jgi:hypothetical protein
VWLLTDHNRKSITAETLHTCELDIVSGDADRKEETADAQGSGSVGGYVILFSEEAAEV